MFWKPGEAAHHVAQTGVGWIPGGDRTQAGSQKKADE